MEVRLQNVIWCLQKLSGDGRTPLSITTSHISNTGRRLVIFKVSVLAYKLTQIKRS